MQSSSKEIEKIVVEGARRLLARASENHALSVELLTSRITAAVEKYLLRNDENRTDKDIRDFIDGMQADDLCLIIACEQSDEQAWNELVARFTATVRSAARSASANEDLAEDLAQSIWAELYGLRSRKDGNPASKLAYYSGRGSLAGWLRAVVSQLAVDTYRKQSRFVQTEEDADLDRLAESLPGDGRATIAVGRQNPEQTMANRFAESDLQHALQKSVTELTASDRLLVKLYYFDNLRLREAGTVLGVHEATASRRLTRIHGELRQRVGEILISEHGWTKSEAERSFADVAAHLDADLETLLTNKGVS
jgi:RNA polymerase sigma-70 factor (ECF subfamily)